MPSSTSASDARRGFAARWAPWVLIAGCVSVAAAAEVVARAGLDRASKIQHRLVDEYRAAREIGCDRRQAQTDVLVVGNSLLDEGVHFEQVRSGLAGECDARRLVVEQTAYFDWYYGLKRLFREGARPDIVVVVLSPSQWVRPDSRGDYTAQYLLSTADVMGAAHDLGLNATQTSGLFFARLSKFWGARTEIRNYVLGHLMPDLGRLMNFSSYIDPTPIVDVEIEEKARGRIERLNALVREHDARLVILVPPVLVANDGARGLAAAAAPCAVPVIRPVTSGTYTKEFYRDTGFHLNAAGAARFTEQFVHALRRELRAEQNTPGVVPTSGASEP
jgi:hypothetical protein